jgi:hypothetical protein
LKGLNRRFSQIFTALIGASAIHGEGEDDALCASFLFASICENLRFQKSRDQWRDLGGVGDGQIMLAALHHMQARVRQAIM